MHDWVEKVIYWELCKQIHFYHSDQWYIHKPKPVLENETHEILWDFGIKMGHSIQAKWWNKTCQIMDFTVLSNTNWDMKVIKLMSKYFDLIKKPKMLGNMKMLVKPAFIGPLRMISKSLGNRLDEIGSSSWNIKIYWTTEEACCHSVSSIWHQLLLVSTLSEGIIITTVGSISWRCFVLLPWDV